MQVQFIEKGDFVVYGYAVETILSACEQDVGQLWEQHRENLLGIAAGKSPLYGVMWYTENHRYYYLLGIESEIPPQSDMTAVKIPAAYFAVASVPEHMSSVEAWTQYFEKELPALFHEPDAAHGKYFEVYDENGNCELWTPVKRVDSACLAPSKKS